MNNLRPDYEQSNSYSTSITKGLKEKATQIADAIEKLSVLHGKESSLLLEENGIVILKGEVADIPAFAHPIYKNGKVYVDARAFVNKEGNIKDLSEWSLLKKRGLIELAWIMDKADFGSQSELVGDVFASWFSNGIAKRLNMGMADAQYLRILAAIYYTHFLHRRMEMGDDEMRVILVKTLPKMLRVPVTMVEELLDTIGIEVINKLYNYHGKEERDSTYYLDILLNTFNTLTDHIYRLDKTLVFNSLTRGAFIAANAPELTAMAIEYPPIFFIMIQYAIEKGIHGKTTIGLTTLSVINKHDSSKFSKFMTTIYNPSH